MLLVVVSHFLMLLVELDVLLLVVSHLLLLLVELDLLLLVVLHLLLVPVELDLLLVWLVALQLFFRDSVGVWFCNFFVESCDDFCVLPFG